MDYRDYDTRLAAYAVIRDDAGRVLLALWNEADLPKWTMPGGGVELDETVQEAVVREVHEETGIVAEVRGLLGVFDGQRRAFSRIPLYSLVFHCHAVGGELEPHPLECLDVGWFARDALPEPLASGSLWVQAAFDAIDGKVVPSFFDAPRGEVWNHPA